MEAIAALGLVCNILQIVDAAGKAYNVCHEIYTLGASIEDQRMAYTSKQLQEAYTALNTSLKGTRSTSSQVPPTQVNLSDLGSRCYETAKALHDELLTLQKKPDGGLRESVKVFVNKKEKARGIEQIKTRLDEYRKVLDTKILIEVRQCVSQQAVISGDLQLQLTALDEKLSSFHSTAADQLRTEIAMAIQASEEQHVRTRAHITSQMQNLNTHQEQEQRLQQQRKQFLESLTFPETNLRMNEITASHRDTFQWIFDDDSKRSWNSFTTWLKGDEPVYWIHGKAGSGKSTLMKFLANASRTRDCLQERNPDVEVLIVTYYFWLSGSHSQRSWKGFLCSIIRQTVIDDEPLLDTLLNEQPKLIVKRNINDWDPKELRALLIRLRISRTLPLCFFIDGLDEFDQGDDVESLLSLIEEISSAGKTKFCVSSRPEHYISTRLSKHPQLRLQDLTAADMKILICDELSNARSKCNPAQIDEQRRNKIVETMSQKADGVFLWVRYAVSSLIKGMRSEDNFEDLLIRIDDLPSGMNQLYLQMWNRLNEDQQRYRDDAAMYFSYCVLRPISLFEMVIALSDSLQRMYIECKMPQDPINVSEPCELLEKRLLIRCAGLLETVIDDEKSGTVYCPQYRRLAWEDSHSPIQRMSLEGHLLRHHMTKIKFIHRTARDFLLDSHEGRSLLGQPKVSLPLRCQNVAKASMAVMVQGLERFQSEWVVNRMSYVAENCKEIEVELLTTLKHLCERLSIPGMPSHNIAYHSFWFPAHTPGFECVAVQAGCEQYIRDLLQTQKHHLSHYYLGSLVVPLRKRFFEGFLDGRGWKACSRWLSMTSWLISSGADLRAKHIYRNRVEDVVSLVLSDLCYAYRFTKNMSQFARQAAGIIEQLLRALACSDFDCLMCLNRKDDWSGFRYWWAYDEDRDTMEMDQFVIIRSSATTLCWRVIQLYNLPVSSEIRSTQPPPRRDIETEVLFYGECRRFYPTLGNAFNYKDSILLGQKLDELWSTHLDHSAFTTELAQNFERELQELGERSPRMGVADWAVENGLNFQWEDVIYTLDPSEEVDESNWKEKGWFRKYDARDELHRSPEKLKMIERMEQFPHWGLTRKEGSSHNAKRDDETHSEPSKTRASDNVTGDPQSEAAD